MKLSNKRLPLMLGAALLSGCGMFGPKQAPSAPSSTATGSQLGASAAPAKPAAPKPIDRGDPDARFKAALDLMKQNQPQEAEAALTALVKDFPQYSGPLTDLGVIYFKSKRLDLAASAFAKAINDNPQNSVAYNWQGMLFREGRDYGRAEQAYKHALSLNSDYANAHLNLGILYDVYLKRPADALPHYKDYQRLGGAEDLRVLVWVADIEKAQAAARAATPAPAAKPAAAATPAKPSKPTIKKKPEAKP
jgi:tetratricopeptide (TPR) repeat protein